MVIEILSPVNAEFEEVDIAPGGSVLLRPKALSVSNRVKNGSSLAMSPASSPRKSKRNANKSLRSRQEASCLTRVSLQSGSASTMHQVDEDVCVASFETDGFEVFFSRISTSIDSRGCWIAHRWQSNVTVSLLQC